MSTIFTPVAISLGTTSELTLCGNPSSTTSMPSAATSGGSSWKARSVTPSRFGWAADSGSPT